MSEIAGKNIVISGGARGIGRLMAVKMARLGGRVILYDLNAAALEAVVDEIGATPPACRRALLPWRLLRRLCRR